MMKKILMIGLGAIGQRHLRNLRAVLGDDCEFSAFRVRGLSQVITPKLTIDDTVSVEEEFGLKSFYSLEEALSGSPDIAFICNPSSFHVPVAQKCAEAGCDLFIEKPLSDSIDGLERLIDTVERRSLIATVGYQLRYHPCIVKLGSVIRSKKLGTLLSVRASVGEYLPNFHRYEDYRTSYAARADMGGGVILTQIHEFDYLYSLFGMPSAIYGVGGHWSYLDVNVEDVASVLMHCTADGRPLPVHVQQDYLQDPPSRQCEVIGDRGRVVADLVNLRVTVFMPSAEPDVTSFAEFDRNTMFLAETQHFLDCVRTRQQPDVSITDGVQSLRMALAAKKSISLNELVRI